MKNYEKKTNYYTKISVKFFKKCKEATPSSGLGKPEALRHNLIGFWSRRLSQKDRVIYKFKDVAIHIFAIGGHYD